MKSQNQEPKQNWCKNHPLSLWVEPYKQCAQGFRLKEKCVKGNIEKDYEN
jgi:hypothetical protein